MSDGYDSTEDTLNHIDGVQQNLYHIAGRLIQRAFRHDKSKLLPPEKETFDRCTPKLKGLTFGSPEYEAAKKELGNALTHHYSVNPHHPENWKNGIDGMSLVDIVEMVCDWVAATKRHADGDIDESIRINAERFGISQQLVTVIRNTVERHL